MPLSKWPETLPLQENMHVSCHCSQSIWEIRVPMSVYRTLKLRSLNPTHTTTTIVAAVKTYLTTGQLPPLPDAPIANG